MTSISILFFRQEASYLPDIDTLPRPHSVKNEVLLMTICLSSCGQVATDRCGGQVLRAANIYQALVTWLLSLVSTCCDSAQKKVLHD